MTSENEIFADDCTRIAAIVASTAMSRSNGDIGLAIAAVTAAQHALLHALGPEKAEIARGLINNMTDVSSRADAMIRCETNSSGGES